MKNLLFLLFAASLILTLTGCDKPCGCTGPMLEAFNFNIIDSAGVNQVDSETWVQQYYYLDNGYKTPIGDMHREEIYYQDDTTVNPGYFFQTDIPASKSVEGMKESYIEIVPGDIDTIFIEAVKKDEMTRSVTEVTFNGMPCKKDPKYPSFIWQIPKNMKR